MTEKKNKNTYIEMGGSHRLVFDSLCMWIEEFIPSKEKRDGSQSQETWKRVSGYHTKITELIQSLENKLFLQIEGIYTLGELSEAQSNMHDEIRKLCEGLKDIKELNR